MLTHKAMPGLVKCGATRKHPIQRATELSAGTGVPGQFTVAYYVTSEDCFEVENACHQYLSDRRVDQGREFFEASVEEVVGYVRGLTEAEADEGGDWIEGGGTTRPPIEKECPWGVLFASFQNEDDHKPLTEEEQAKCRELWRSHR